jgi:DNA-binding MarR family transcriptional regulator
MKLSELRSAMVENNVVFEELLLLDMIRDMEAQTQWELGVKIMDVVTLASSSKISSPATTFKYIAHLNSKTLLSKEQSEKDARTTLVSVTSVGKKLLEKIDG